MNFGNIFGNHGHNNHGHHDNHHHGHHHGHHHHGHHDNHQQESTAHKIGAAIGLGIAAIATKTHSSSSSNSNQTNVNQNNNWNQQPNNNQGYVNQNNNNWNQQPNNNQGYVNQNNNWNQQPNNPNNQYNNYPQGQDYNQTQTYNNSPPAFGNPNQGYNQQPQGGYVAVNQGFNGNAQNFQQYPPNHQVRASKKTGKDSHYGSHNFNQFHDTNIKNEQCLPEIDMLTVYYTSNLIVGIEARYKTQQRGYIGNYCNRGSYNGQIQQASIQLSQGEYFTEISGRSGDSIDRLHIVTSKKQKLEVGGNGGKKFDNLIPKHVVSLAGIGGSTRDFLDSLYVIHQQN